VVEVLELEGEVYDDDATGEETTQQIAEGLIKTGTNTAVEEIEVDEDDGESGDEMIYNQKGLDVHPEQVISDLEDNNETVVVPVAAKPKDERESYTQSKRNLA
jgi:phytoene dehydrogenase-like protein